MSQAVFYDSIKRSIEKEHQGSKDQGSKAAMDYRNKNTKAAKLKAARLRRRERRESCRFYIVVYIDFFSSVKNVGAVDTLMTCHMLAVLT